MALAFTRRPLRFVVVASYFAAKTAVNGHLDYLHPFISTALSPTHEAMDLRTALRSGVS